MVAFSAAGERGEGEEAAAEGETTQGGREEGQEDEEEEQEGMLGDGRNEGELTMKNGCTVHNAYTYAHT